MPTAAVQKSPQGNFVYVVKPDNTVTQRGITVGATQGDLASIASGLTQGETVVTDGVDKLQPGAKVNVHMVATATPGDTIRRAMSLSRPFILRPIATTLLMAAILLAGLVAFKQLPVSALPEVDYPTIQVLTFYPGASPDVMASSVTAPLERQFGQVPGLNQMTSNSSFGSSVITLQFDLNLSIDVAEQEVQEAINAAATYLPTDLPNPPVYSKTNPADAPILTLGLTSTELPLDQVEDLADTRLSEKISQVSGRRAGEYQRRSEAVGADPGQSDPAVGIRNDAGGPAHRRRGLERESGEGELRREGAGVHDRRQRSVAHARTITSRW